jgi:hypothetical protein
MDEKEGNNINMEQRGRSITGKNNEHGKRKDGKRKSIESRKSTVANQIQQIRKIKMGSNKAQCGTLIRINIRGKSV